MSFVPARYDLKSSFQVYDKPASPMVENYKITTTLNIGCPHCTEAECVTSDETDYVSWQTQNYTANLVKRVGLNGSYHHFLYCYAIYEDDDTMIEVEFCPKCGRHL